MAEKTDQKKKKASAARAAAAEGAKERAAALFVVGKRKRSVARAVIKPGKGIVRINSRPIDLVEPELARMRIKEPLMLAEGAWKRFDISVNVRGGGVSGQADAARQAIAKALVGAIGKDLRKVYLDYDRNLLIYDPRRTETHKPPRSSQGPRRHKQRSKR